MFVIVATIMDLPAVKKRAALGFQYDPRAWQDLGTGHNIFLTVIIVLASSAVLIIFLLSSLRKLDFAEDAE